MVSTGQQEIISHLRMLRQTGDHEFQSIRAIAHALGCRYNAVHSSIYPLARVGILESRAMGDLLDWYRGFRLADKYIDGNGSPFKDGETHG